MSTRTEGPQPGPPSAPRDSLDELLGDMPIVILPDAPDADELDETLPDEVIDTGDAPQTLRKRVTPLDASLAVDPQDVASLFGVEGVERSTAGAADMGPSLADIEAEVEDELRRQHGFRQMIRVPRPLVPVACVFAGVCVLLLIVGWNYYSLPLNQRLFHHLHELLRPSGLIGLPLGIVGTLMIAASLFYLVRTRVAVRARLGNLRTWMGFHIFTGLVGPAIVLFHAAFVPASAVGWLALGSMVVVVASGVMGRYIYVYFPKSLNGRELEFETVRHRLRVYRRKLSDLGVDATVLGIDDDVRERPRAWLVTALASLVLGDRESRREYRQLREVVSSHEMLRGRTEETLMLVRRLCRERQWLVRYSEFRKLMGTWRFLHRWLAVVLVAAIVYHIAISVRFGDLWILDAAWLPDWLRSDGGGR